jgi:hypothetical protein
LITRRRTEKQKNEERYVEGYNETEELRDDNRPERITRTEAADEAPEREADENESSQQRQEE